MTTLELAFPAALALAGAAYLLGVALVRLFPTLERNYLPEPVLGGLVVAVALLLLRAVGPTVDFPTSGLPVDVLVSLLTANMGLHVTPRVLRQGVPLFFAFLALGLVLSLGQLLLALPFALQAESPLHTAFLAGPLSLVGAPFNLNPPDQTAPLEGLFATAYPNLGTVAQGSMMIGVVAGIFLAALMGRRLERRAGADPPLPPRKAVGVPDSLSGFAERMGVTVAILFLVIAAAIGLQGLLQRAAPSLREDHLPVILLAYLIAALVRLGSEGFAPGRFPERALTALLLGPTMGLVFSYAVMSLPLHHVGEVPLRVAAGTAVGLAGSLGAAWFGFALFARFTNRYYAAVVATAFLAVTTAWGPVGMAYLRFFMREEGSVEPMPVVMPMNAFFLFPWLVILLGHLIL